MNDLDTIADRLAALGNPTRLALFRLLMRAGDNGLPVGRLQESLSIPASTLSHHLKLLESVGLANRRREGVTHFCGANYDSLDGVIGYLVEECCADIPLEQHKHRWRRSNATAASDAA